MTEPKFELWWSDCKAVLTTLQPFRSNGNKFPMLTREIRKGFMSTASTSNILWA